MHRIVRLQLANIELDLGQHVVHHRALELRAGPGRGLGRIIIAGRLGLSGPCRGDRRCCVGPQQLARRLGFGRPIRAATDRAGSAGSAKPLRSLPTLSNEDLTELVSKPEDQRRKGHQHRDDELDKLDHLPAAVALRQERAD